VQALSSVVSMGSWQEELARRLAASRQRIEALRRELVEVQSWLEVEEDRLSRLEITQETMQEIRGETARTGESVLVSEDVAVDTQASESGGEPEVEVVRRGVMLVPPWEPGLELSVLPRAYRDVLEVLADAGEAMRAVRISAALGRGESAAKVEGLRGKLKRLTERGWLTEDEPGMFALVEHVRRQITR
jgi:hypothetical protein